MGSLLVVLFWSNNGHNGHNGHNGLVISEQSDLLSPQDFHRCRSGPERSCFHVAEGVLRPTQVPWSIELWLHPIISHQSHLLRMRDPAAQAVQLFAPGHSSWLPAGRGLSGTDGTHVTTIGSRNIQELKSMFILGSTIPAISEAYSYFLILSQIPDLTDLTDDTCQNHPKPMRFYCLFVDRLWTEWYPLVPVAALCVFLLTSLRLGRIRGQRSTKCRDETSMGHGWP